MKKILSLNMNPYIRTYTHHGFYHAVISSEDKVNYDMDKEVALVQVNSFNKYVWEKETDQLTYKFFPENIIKFYGNKWNINMNASFWRKCNDEDEISISIQKQLYTNTKANIIIFLANDSIDTMLNSSELYYLQVGNYSKEGIVCRIKNYPKEVFFSPVMLPVDISLKKCGNNFTVKYSTEKQHGEKTFVLEDLSFNRIGFAINLGCNSYYEWMYSNYINIYFNKKNIMPIDYLWNTHKNWDMHTTNYFIDYNAETEITVKKIGISVIEYIIKMIDMNRYVETLINDNIHNSVSKKQKIQFHPDLIYGYNDEEEILYLLYYKNGKPIPAVMKYEDFMSESNHNDRRVIYIYKYNPDFDVYRLSHNNIIQQYRELFLSLKLSKYDPYYEEGYCFGMECYKELLSNEGMHIVLSDIRVSHLLYERGVCNKNRMEYLYYKKIISRDLFCEIRRKMDDYCKTALLLRNAVLKRMMCHRPDCNAIKNYLFKLAEYENQIVNYVLTRLA